MPNTTPVCIIDYRMGNLRSVAKAIEHVGGTAKMVSKPGEIERAEKLILPGVGAFGDAMRFLDEMGLSDPIRAYVQSGRPMLGVCLGMQLLFDGSEEDAADGELVKGLGILPGKVVRFDNHRGGQHLNVPHMGWNGLKWSRPDPILDGLDQGSAVYFVHSYYAEPANPDDLSATADYGGDFCASVHRNNLFATQFHPEKSQRVGMRILTNFVGV